MTSFPFLTEYSNTVLSNKSIDVEVHEALVVQIASLGIKQGSLTQMFSSEFVSNFDLSKLPVLFSRGEHIFPFCLVATLSPHSVLIY